MIKTKLVAAVSAVMLLLSAGGSWACEVAGPNKHVGQITKIDKLAGTFTIMDAEKGEPITFSFPSEKLTNLAKVKGQVMVGYEEKDGQLVAVDIHY